MRYFIKNMVCNRCIRTVEQQFTALVMVPISVQLGVVELADAATQVQLTDLKVQLEREGFELLDDRNTKLIEKIKTLIIHEIHYDNPQKPNTMNFSEYLSHATLHDYSQLSKLFSTVEGITIEKYIILQKIERVKELLLYDELTLSEIADQVGYKSTQHVSNQFKQVTGLTPTQFKSEIAHHGRKNLDNI